MEHTHHKAMALADAELSAAEVPALIHELARNPSLVRALQVYIAVGRQRVAKVYDTKREEPVPQWLIDTVMHAPVERAAVRSASKRSVGRDMLKRLKERYTLPGWSLAAGPAFAALLIAASAWLLVPPSSHGDTLLAAQLQHAIETTASGQDAALLSFRPVLTFRDKDQAYCRQFEIRSGVERSAALACRQDTGVWQVVMQTPPGPLGTTPAGAREDLARFVASRMSGDPLDAKQVDQLKDRGWPQN
ncbi:MAG: hypothetical protein K2X43_04485 [Hyphomonadaceae bacterium]|jgi:hypothetical protein|nr:hypothetical protein [Hyphomonadaceae bacterium]